LKNAKQTDLRTVPGFKLHGVKEGTLIAFSALGLYLLMALMTYDKGDPGWSSTGTNMVVGNAMGSAGAWVSDVLFSLFGYMAYLFPLMLGYRAWMTFRERSNEPGFDWVTLGIRFIGFSLVMLASTALTALNGAPDLLPLPEGSGGILGGSLADVFEPAFGLLGSRLILASLLLFGITIFTDLSWLRLMDRVGQLTVILFNNTVTFLRNRYDRFLESRETKKMVQKRKEVIERQVEKKKKEPVLTIAPPKKKAQPSERAQKEKQKPLFESPDVGELPTLGLLDMPEKDSAKGYSDETLKAMSTQLELKLKDFGVVAEVVAVYPGPVITRFEIQPAPGVKVSRISNLAKDLARSLAVISVRVVEVIPGKSVVGIEIPNENREMVLLGEVLSSSAYEASKSPLSLALGHDISGDPVVVDLARMPHLLVAGTTGAGKSVGVNAMLLSLLYKSTPAEVRLIMVDPKMLELSVYDGIPHLLTPVITDMKEAANGLRWCVAEMERRYRLMASLGVRNLAGFNRKVGDAIKAGNPIADPLWNPDVEYVAGEEQAPAPPLEPLPSIVVVIDEFADMMMIVGKKVEELIARIAQKARAAGIHLILATQRPSVDVITGLIKANVPTRIAFQVSSKVDSRTILDQGGAEQLLGHGDMLYLPPGSGVPIRVHGAFVDDHEVHKVVKSWKERAEPNYIEGLLDVGGGSDMIPGMGGADGDDDDSENDELYDQAVQYVLETRRASISSVQRKLRIGYNRAARMIEAMEAAGVISEMGANGSREVLAPSGQGE
jgi:S-DNA-T family DNA segregation ATPase FtsK/SpoIIIE